MKTLLVFLFLSVGAHGQVLHIGDSLSVGAFGADIYNDLKNRGIDISTRAVGGSVLGDYLTGKATSLGYRVDDKIFAGGKVIPNPKIEDLVAQKKPKFVVIQNGTNSAWAFVSPKYGPSFIKDQTQRFLEKLGKGTGCLYILPPKRVSKTYNEKMQNELALTLLEAVGDSCKIFDTRGYFDEHYKKLNIDQKLLVNIIPPPDGIKNFKDFKPGPDNVHFSKGEYKRWASEVLKYLPELVTSSRPKQ
ncbi:SGNH/GDSL hydrolase family protein [bacterium]|nr:SGNH/GDSL hydrolase family protein [bacterium]